eukprot:3691522-Alexandrium_andersonii.AAC.1
MAARLRGPWLPRCTPVTPCKACTSPPEPFVDMFPELSPQTIQATVPENATQAEGSGFRHRLGSEEGPLPGPAGRRPR